MQRPWHLGALLAVLLLALPVVHAQISLQDALLRMPDCATPCVFSAVTESGCDTTNRTCICSNTKLKSDVETCVFQACTVKQALTTENATMAFCSATMRDRGQMPMTLAIVLIIISSLMVAQRFAYKVYAKMEIGTDDWLALVTLLVAIPLTCLELYGTKPNGLGRDIWTVPFDNIYKFGKYFLMMEVVYFAEVMFLKLSIIFFYLRIFPARPIRRLLWGTVIFNCLFGAIFMLVTAFVQCKPISHFWEFWDGEHKGYCYDLNAIAWSNAGISIALDLWILAIPMFQLHSLQLSWRKKVGVGAMFSVGTFVTIVSILRLRSIVTFSASTKNPTWEYVDVTVWSNIEINVGMWCICMPALRQLLIKLFPKALGTTQQYANEHSQRSDIAGRSGNRYGSKSNGGMSGSGTDSGFSRKDSGFSNRKPQGRMYDPELMLDDEIQLVTVAETDAKSSKSEASYHTQHT